MRSTLVLAAVALIAFGVVTAGIYLSTKDRNPADTPQPPQTSVPEPAVQAPAPGALETTQDTRPGNRARMDTNADGMISFDEAVAVHPEMTREQFNARDTNGDGVWNADEGFGPGGGMGYGMRGGGGGGGGGGRGMQGGAGGRGMRGGGGGGGYRGGR
ncbi:MAG TPA: hypothetical protein PLB67_12025 [Candidatus Hydrogenedentes bacterium]|nr:hypothetical protein [Candidatus Hydrogenedentota bacterium]